jgi:DNA polymerase elongation subunit (family B)
MKKRYISRAFASGPDRPGHVEYKGIELVRKDSLPFCNALYAGLVDMIFGSGIGQGPAKSKTRIAEDIVEFLSREFEKVYRRDPCYDVASFALTKTLQNRSRYKVR